MRGAVSLLLLLCCGSRPGAQAAVLTGGEGVTTKTTTDVWMELQVLKEKVERLDRENAALGHRVTEGEDEAQCLKVMLQLHKEELRKEAAALRVQLSQSNAELNATNAELQLQKTMVEDLEVKNAAEDSAVSLLRDMMMSTDVRLNSTEREVEEQRMEAAALRAQLSASNTELQLQKKMVEDLKRWDSDSGVSSLRVRVTDTESELDEQRMEVAALRAELSASSTELQLQKMMVEDLEREHAAQHSGVSSLRDRVNSTEWEVQEQRMEAAAHIAELSASNIELQLQKETVLEDLKRENAAQDSAVSSLRDRLNSTESEVEEQRMEAAALRAELSASNTELQLQKKMMEDLERENTARDSAVSSLRDRLNSTESEVEEQRMEAAALRAELSASNTELQLQKKMVEDLERENAARDSAVSSVRDMVSLSLWGNSTERQAEQDMELAALRAELSTSNAELQLQKMKVEDLERGNAAQDSEVSSLRDMVLNITESEVEELQAGILKVAFSTSLTDDGQVGPFSEDRILIYSKVITNTGQAYNSNTGVFTAPVRGVYYFRFTVKRVYTTDMGVMLYRNDELVMFEYDYEEHGHGDVSQTYSNAVVLELQLDDRVYMKLPAGKMIYDDSYNRSTFSGFMLFT